MGETTLLIMVVCICVVFVGSFIATLFNPNYQFAAVFAPVMTSAVGLVAGIALARARGNGNGNGNGKK